MKTTNLTTLVSLAVMIAGIARVVAAEPVMRDVATHDQLVVTLRKVEQADPMKQLAAAKGGAAAVVKSEDPSVVNKPKSLLGESDIISFDGLATLVPKRAIMQIPVGYADRIKIEPGVKIVGWADFYAVNRGWITTVEISRVQAEGMQPLADDTKKQMTKCRNLVVATYQGGPISMLPPKPTTEPTTKQP